MQPVPARNLLLTKTALGVYIMLLSTLITVSPKIEAMIKRNASEANRANYIDLISIVVSCSGSIIAAVGRYQAGGTYTPKYLPGIDPPLQ